MDEAVERRFDLRILKSTYPFSQPSTVHKLLSCLLTNLRKMKWQFVIEYRNRSEFSPKAFRLVDLGSLGGGFMTLFVSFDLRLSDDLTPRLNKDELDGKLTDDWKATVEAAVFEGDVLNLSAYRA